MHEHNALHYYKKILFEPVYVLEITVLFRKLRVSIFYLFFFLNQRTF